MCELKALAGLPYPQRLAEFNLVNHFLRYIHNSAVMGRSHIEFRFPYFDPALMAFCVALPYEMAEDRAVQKAIIMREMPHLAAVPTSDDEMPLTDHKMRHMAAKVKLKLQQSMNRYVAPIFSDHDTLYADYEQWMRTDLRQWAEGILFSERATSRRIFRPEAVRSLFDRHMAGQELWTIGKIAPLITFEMMLCAFIDGVGALLG
jgi:asparagine synthase (glutamine-hydrolysing)